MRSNTKEAAHFAEILKRLPLFSELSNDDIQRVAAGARERKMNKGELLFQRGDTPRGFFYVISGQIKLAISSPQGNEKIVEIVPEGQSFGEAVMFLNRPYPVFAEALSDAVLAHVSLDPIMSQIEGDAEFSKKLLAGMAIRLHTLVQDVETYTLKSSLQRVIGYLLQISEVGDGDETTVLLPTSKQVLASRLHLTPETLSRIFHELTESGLITVNGRQVFLHSINRLSQYYS